MMHNVYLIAGPNGAGKTTFAREFLPELELYRPLLDSWTLFDNSGLQPDIIVSEKRGVLNVVQPDCFQAILQKLEDSKHG